MSSILKALKKLDNLPSAREQSSPLKDLKLPPSKIRRDLWPPSQKTILYAGIAVVSAFILILFWSFGNNPDDGATQPEKKMAVVLPAKNDLPNATVPPAKNTPKLAGTSGAPRKDALKATPAPKPATPTKRSLKKATFNQKTTFSPPPATPAASTPKAAPFKEPIVPLLEDQKLKMQAISWAVQPENRIAVINAKIVREGDSIEGYRIAEIREDGVIVSKGGIAHKLELRLK